MNETINEIQENLIENENQHDLPSENTIEETNLESEESTNENTNDSSNIVYVSIPSSNQELETETIQNIDSNITKLESTSNNVLYLLLINNIFILSILIYLFLHFLLERRKV